MPDALVIPAAWMLALAFAWAAVAKVIESGAWRTALEGYALPGPLAALARPAVPVAEAAVVALIVFVSLTAGAALALVLLASFSAVVVRASAQRGSRLPCGCFGSSKTRDVKVILGRNAVLALLAAAPLLGDREEALTGALGMPEGGELLPFALALAGIALGIWSIIAAASMFRKGHP